MDDPIFHVFSIAMFFFSSVLKNIRIFEVMVSFHYPKTLTCIESALIISPLNLLANSMDSLVFPVPVEPKITINGTFLNIIYLEHCTGLSFFNDYYFNAFLINYS